MVILIYTATALDSVVGERHNVAYNGQIVQALLREGLLDTVAYQLNHTLRVDAHKAVERVANVVARTALALIIPSRTHKEVGLAVLGVLTNVGLGLVEAVGVELNHVEYRVGVDVHVLGVVAHRATLYEANARLEKYGKNRLAAAKGKSIIVRFLEQLKDPMILILLAAALISGVLSVVENESFADVIIILAVVIINAVLGVYQESKAEKAIEALQEMSAATSKVLRDGKVQIVHSEDLVVGDVV
ncbi:MAG: hypothetical protein IIV06_07205, partial [Alistipes sp.]|nr:hypothetical protein [Alistipes sp.]